MLTKHQHKLPKQKGRITSLAYRGKPAIGNFGQNNKEVFFFVHYLINHGPYSFVFKLTADHRLG